ncbi:hypothetical protein JCM19239_2145 [Vibrio variabilis]|uniref:Uncharacterized protein n=1 Tax=Vibrio variabilis TaxID=990271 RepID=A0ABQ0JJG1_9VIBR|nr:hypothetical protein JCM19239_2145 [Vibrio variabilis]
MSIKEHISKLGRQIELRKAAKQFESKIADNSTILKRLDKVNGELQEQTKRTQLLMRLDRFEGKSLEIAQDVEQSASNAKNYLERYRTLWNEKNYLALQDNCLKDTEEQISKYTDQLKAITKESFEQWCSEQIAKFEVGDVILEQQKTFPDKVKIHDDYVSEQRAFNNLVNSFAWTESELHLLFQKAGQLADLYDQMNHEALPEEVKKFLSGVRSVSTRSTLSLLTPEVLEWLKENQMLDMFVVSQSGYAKR